MRLTLIILCLLFISACTQEINDRLQGHWVCVENCDEIKTLDFYKDSVEINRYLKFLRIKEKSFYKFNSEKDSLYCENTFYNEKRREIFYFALEGNVLIFGAKESVFRRKNSSVAEDFEKFLSFNEIGLRLPVIKEFHPAPPEYFGFVPKFLLIKYHLGKPCFYENNTYYPIERISGLLQNWNSCVAEEESSTNDFYLCIDRSMRMKDVDSLFNTIGEAGYYRLNLLYNVSKFNTDLPEKCLVYYKNPFRHPLDNLNYQFLLYENLKIKHPLLKDYFSLMKEKAGLKIQMKNGQVFLNDELCNNNKDVFEKYKNFFSVEKNPNAFIKIDTMFLKEYASFFNGSFPDKFEILIDVHQREIETKKKILQILPAFYTLKFWNYSFIEIDPSTTYQEWMEMYLNLVSIHDKIRSEICNEFFQRDYYKLNKNILEDQEIIKMVRNILPFRLIPYIISPQ